MSNFTVRELVIRVSLMRPDLDVGLAERLTQEAAKRCFRESFLGQVITTVYPLGSNCNEIMLTSQIPYWNAGLPNYLQPSDLNKLILPTTWDGSTPDYLSGINPVPAQKTAAEVLRVLQVRTVTLPFFAIGVFQGWVFATGNATFNATATGTTLTVLASPSPTGALGLGQYITAPSYAGTAPPYISAMAPTGGFTGTGGAGTYGLSNASLGTIGTSTAMSSNPVPSAANVVNGGFFLVYQGTVATGTLLCKGGDVLQSNGSNWSLTPLENYDTLNQINWQTQQVYTNRPKSSWNSSLTSGPTMNNITQSNSWSQRSGQMQTTIGVIGGLIAANPTFAQYAGTIIDLYPTQGYPTAIEVTYSATPIGDIADIVLNMPDEARDAIVNLALADWLAVPGKEQNLILSENRRMEYERLKGGLRALGSLGLGGSSQFRAPLFGGRGNRYFPFAYNPTLLPGPN
jgi:hypothetical protein